MLFLQKTFSDYFPYLDGDPLLFWVYKTYMDLKEVTLAGGTLPSNTESHFYTLSYIATEGIKHLIRLIVSLK